MATPQPQTPVAKARTSIPVLYPFRGVKIRSLFIAAAIAGLVYLYLRAAEYEIPYWQLALIAIAIVYLSRLVANQRNPVVDPGVPPNMSALAEPATVRPSVADWERLLAYIEKYPDLYHETATQSKLWRITADRLRIKHHINLADDPDGAREFIGQPLFDFLHRPLDTCPTKAEFDYFLTQIEKI